MWGIIWRSLIPLLILKTASSRQRVFRYNSYFGDSHRWQQENVSNATEQASIWEGITRVLNAKVLA